MQTQNEVNYSKYQWNIYPGEIYSINKKARDGNSDYILFWNYPELVR